MMTREFRIYVDGKFQFSVKSADSAGTVASNAADVMKLGARQATFSRGVINFAPGSNN